MKTKVKNWINVVLGAILGLFGFGCFSCAKYGVPYGDFTCEGQVTNQDDEKKKKMQVVHRDGMKDAVDSIHWSSYADTLYTNADGIYYVHGITHLLPSPIIHEIVVNDPSGFYQSQSFTTTVDYSGGDDEEAYIKHDFVLKKK